MESTVEKEFSPFGGLFQQIIVDLKNSAPVWEDFLIKATKFHSQLKATIVTSTSFLDAFQKIADMATNTRGATKEIGSALTRLCLRQRSVESKLKTFANSLQESLIYPLQEKLEEWKKMASHLDKDHAKDCKRAKQELKKKSSDTLRLQKKVRKVGVVDIRRTLDYALQDVTDMYLLLEETEKQSIRKALIEERSHFCFFVGYLQPVLESEIKMLNEINHLEEVIDTLSKITGDPHVLPVTSEQVITDLKSSSHSWSFRSPPSSPGSLGSRKSSVCSISSANSSSSGSLKYNRQLSYCQYATVGRQHKFIASHDSGFASQDTLFTNSSLSSVNSAQLSSFAESKPTTLSTPSSPLPSVTSTWPNLQETEQFESQPSAVQRYQRPHTISSAYEKSNHRPALTAHTFEPLDGDIDQRAACASVGTFKTRALRDRSNNHSHPGTPVYSRPCIPERNEDANRDKPSLPDKSVSVRAKHGSTNKCLPDFNMTPADQIVPHPVYANTNEVGSKSVKEKAAAPSTEPKEYQSRRDLAMVLNEGLLLQSIKHRNENSPVRSSAPIIKSCNPPVGASETLPRSREMDLQDYEMMQWQMYVMSLCNSNSGTVQAGVHQRPASVAGVAESFHIPRKASTLQRMGSTPGNKPPPTPVRRSSSITSSSASNGSLSIRDNGSSGSISSGGGEVCYSPSLKEFSKNNSSSEGALTRGRSYSPLRHVKRERDHSREFSRNSSTNGDDSDSEKGIVTDVSDSRARLIQDLNSTIQKKAPPSRQSSQGDPPAVPPRNTSKHDQDNYEKIDSMHENSRGLYGKLERQGQTFNAKPMLCQEISTRSYQRKPPVPTPGTPDHAREFSRSQSYQQSPGCGAGEEKHTFKHSFMATLNAKLALHHQNYASPYEIEKHQYQAAACRESLMDQIKRGTTLRRVTCNDRSVPRLA